MMINYTMNNVQALECANFLQLKSTLKDTTIYWVSQFFFAFPAHYANCERIFPLIYAQWTKERGRLSVENVRHILWVKFNFSHYNCAQFKIFLMKPESARFVQEISITEKYGFGKKENEFDLWNNCHQ